MTAKTLALRRPLQPSTWLLIAAEWLDRLAARRETRRRHALDRRLLSEMSDRALADLGIARDQIGRLTGAAEVRRTGIARPGAGAGALRDPCSAA